MCYKIYMCVSLKAAERIWMSRLVYVSRLCMSVQKVSSSYPSLANLCLTSKCIVGTVEFRGMSETILPGLPVTLAWAGWLHTDLCFCWLRYRDMMLHGRMIAPARHTNAQCVSSPSIVCLGLWHQLPNDSKHWVDQQGTAPSPGFLNIESEVGQR